MLCQNLLFHQFLHVSLGRAYAVIRDLRVFLHRDATLVFEIPESRQLAFAQSQPGKSLIRRQGLSEDNPETTAARFKPGLRDACLPAFFNHPAGPSSKLLDIADQEERMSNQFVPRLGLMVPAQIVYGQPCRQRTRVPDLKTVIENPLRS